MDDCDTKDISSLSLRKTELVAQVSYCISNFDHDLESKKKKWEELALE